MQSALTRLVRLTFELSIPDAAAEAPSRRELDVLSRVLQGMTSREIAADLAISPRTVELYRRGLVRKFGARNTADLVRKVLTLPLTGEPEVLGYAPGPVEGEQKA